MLTIAIIACLLYALWLVYGGLLYIFSLPWEKETTALTFCGRRKLKIWRVS